MQHPEYRANTGRSIGVGIELGEKIDRFTRVADCKRLTFFANLAHAQLARKLMSRPDRTNSPLPTGMALLLCSRVQAAALLNVGPSTFDRLRKTSDLLRPVKIGSRPLWPLRNLEAFVFELIDGGADDDPWSTASA
ncbi:helix-turn-helix transcriptional regulator [Hyphomicrobium sp. 1Nfss2.1]|uniref:helix-turn-helix transcriptional regulator n=1 Tax=Hyphomicrobium sp. 1Nfss2.1 TaxID=3413936 RepID=UPI003C7E11EA